MGIPTLTLADLLALRDGEELIPGFEMALRGDPSAPFTLLEHRLLALALTMSSGGAARAASLPLATDPATLEGYVTGTLAGNRLAAYEKSVRGNPERFAELIDFKNDFFGRSKRESIRPIREPRIEREELGVLMLRSIGSQTFVSWHPRTPTEDQNYLYAAAEYSKPYRRTEDDTQQLLAIEKELRDAQSEFNERIETLRRDILMATKTQDLEVLVRLRNNMAALVSDEGRIQRQLRRLRVRVSETLARRFEDRLADENGGPWARLQKIESTLAQFDFAVDSKGSLRLAITGAAPSAEFTWIRPGVSFMALDPDIGTRHDLGRIDQAEALLLISAPGERSQVVRVRRG